MNSQGLRGLKRFQFTDKAVGRVQGFYLKQKFYVGASLVSVVMFHGLEG